MAFDPHDPEIEAMMARRAEAQGAQVRAGLDGRTPVGPGGGRQPQLIGPSPTYTPTTEFDDWLQSAINASVFQVWGGPSEPVPQTPLYVQPFRLATYDRPRYAVFTDVTFDAMVEAVAEELHVPRKPSFLRQLFHRGHDP